MPTEYCDDTTIMCPHCRKWVDLKYRGGYMVAPKTCPHCKKPMGKDDDKQKVLPAR